MEGCMYKPVHLSFGRINLCLDGCLFAWTGCSIHQIECRLNLSSDLYDICDDIFNITIQNKLQLHQEDEYEIAPCLLLGRPATFLQV